MSHTVGNAEIRKHTHEEIAVPEAGCDCLDVELPLGPYGSTLMPSAPTSMCKHRLSAPRDFGGGRPDNVRPRVIQTLS